MRDSLDKTQQGLKRSRETWFGKVASLFDRTRVGDEVWDELEELLIAADVGVTTTQKLIEKVKQRIKAEKLSEGTQVRAVLKEEMVNLLKVDAGAASVSSLAGSQIILVVGVNGSGKTTSIAKLAYGFKNEGKKVILAAADTFRAAAIDQLKRWGERIGVEVVAHESGGDPGAVVYDALQAAQNRQAQVVIIDTAGRLHTKFNLMEELKKIKRVAGKYEMPQEVLLVIDATTGQNGLAQTRHFTEAVGVNGIFLAKLDGTAKGGIVLAIYDELKIPITYIGTGEQLEDIAPFNANTFVGAIFS
ncbi:MAG: signal recognition particle-docking protein FtsY [Chloroflexi bacterium RBG_19FT_COMBO_48_23]|nr:MAG: signal recognition particle-docking protein FtsY [Chloroflexi bacterium RBG_19FT_COMBO_48_23]